MSEKYKIREKKAYFTALMVAGWIDVFTRPNHKMLIVKPLVKNYGEKGTDNMSAPAGRIIIWN